MTIFWQMPLPQQLTNNRDITVDELSFSLLMTTAGVAVIHTFLGPDHYLPFLTMAKAQHWSVKKTLLVVSACGTGHVLSSIVLGLIGLAVGLAIGDIEQLEAGRGDWAAWCMVVFGASYGLWGARHALRHSTDYEAHAHGEQLHIHSHGKHIHKHRKMDAKKMTFWVLFLIFVLGPCEPLIPLFVVPASRGLWGLAIATALVFFVATIITMLAVTLAGLAGLNRFRLEPLERWSHSLAGGTITLCGLAIITLGL